MFLDKKLAINNSFEYNSFEVYYDSFDGHSYTDQNIPTGENITFLVQAFDKNKNQINTIFFTPELFNIEIQSEIENYSFSKDDSIPGF